MIRLSEHLYQIEGPKQSRFPFCSSFLIKDKETILIDTGIGIEKIQGIDRDQRIDVLIISHSHPDHILNWQVLRDRHIMVPEQTPDIVTDLNLLGRRFGGSLQNGEQWAQYARDILGLKTLRDPDSRYRHGEIITSGSVRLEPIHCPGHLDDHYCFLEHSSGTLLTTDIDFTSFGPWYGNPECNIANFKTSIRYLMKLPYTQVCPSHKPPIYGDATDSFLKFLKCFDRHRDAVLNLCDPPKTLDQMAACSPFYRNKAPVRHMQNMFESCMIQKNLEILIGKGLVEENNGIFRRVDIA